MAADDPQTRLRFPSDLRARLEEAAKENARSLNAEVVARLQQSLLPSAQLNDIDALKRMIALMDEASKIKDALIAHYESGQRGADYFWRQSVQDLLTGRKLTAKQRREYELLLDQLNRRLHGQEAVSDLPPHPADR